MRESILFLRSHITVMAGSALLVGILYASVFPTAPHYLTLLNGSCALLIVYGFLDENRRLKFGYKRGGLTGFGEVIGFCAYPRPGTSLLKALGDYADIDPEEIEEIKFQTCSFSNPYLKKLSKFFADAGVPSNTPIEVMGVGNEGDLRDIKTTFPNLSVRHAKQKLRIHFNLVKAHGQYYLWYEPEHDEGEKRYIPSKGAFLVAVDDDAKAIEHFYKPAAANSELVAEY